MYIHSKDKISVRVTILKSVNAIIGRENKQTTLIITGDIGEEILKYHFSNRFCIYTYTNTYTYTNINTYLYV